MNLVRYLSMPDTVHIFATILHLQATCIFSLCLDNSHTTRVWFGVRRVSFVYVFFLSKVVLRHFLFLSRLSFIIAWNLDWAKRNGKL